MRLCENYGQAACFLLLCVVGGGSAVTVGALALEWSIYPLIGMGAGGVVVGGSVFGCIRCCQNQTSEITPVPPNASAQSQTNLLTEPLLAGHNSSFLQTQRPQGAPMPPGDGALARINR